MKGVSRGIFSVFWGNFRAKGLFRKMKRRHLIKKRCLFRERRQSFCSKYEVLSLSKRRFLEIRRRFTIPKRRFIFVNLKKIYKQLKTSILINSQILAKIQTDCLLSILSQAMKLMNLKILNLELLQERRNTNKCKKRKSHEAPSFTIYHGIFPTHTNTIQYL